METKRAFIFRKWKKHLKSIGHKMAKEGFEHLISTGRSEGKTKKD